MSIAETTRPDPLAKARAVKAAKRAEAKRSEVESVDPSPFDIIAELKAEIAELKANRAPPATPPAEVTFQRALVPGQRLSPSQRAKLEEMAEIVPTNPDEYRLQANALTRLKLANPGVWVTVVATRRGRFLRNEQIAPSKYREVVDFTAPDTLAIAGDDLAKVAPGGMGQKFRVGEKALVTVDAAERLVAAGYVEPA